jgi:class 3 adenylate cyclase
LTGETLSLFDARAPASWLIVLAKLKSLFVSRETLAEEILQILRNQEMAGERLVNQVRLAVSAFSLLALLGVLGQAQTSAANTIYQVINIAWFAYAIIVTWLLRNRSRYYGSLKYVSITVDLTITHVAMVASLYNHSGAYELYRNPSLFMLVAALNVMAGLRYTVRASLYSAFLTLAYGTAILTYVRLFGNVIWVDSANVVGEGLNFGECATNVVFASLPAIFAAVIAKNSKRLIVQAAQESLARASLMRDRDRLAKYFSKDVVDLVLNDPASIGLGGRRMNATVLFADIRNFTLLSTKMEPEEVVDLLNRYFSTVVDIIFKHGGTLDKFIGDGVMALFGVPYPLENAPVHAIETALELIHALEAFNKDLEARQMLRIDIGVGINSGPVVAGNIGSSQRHEFTVIGDTVNLAARLEGLNKEAGTQILISESTYQAVKSKFDTRALGPIRIRGKTEPVEVYAIVTPSMSAPPRWSQRPPATV